MRVMLVLALLIMMILLTGNPSAAGAAGDAVDAFPVEIDGKPLSWSGTTYLEKGRILFPARDLIPALKANLHWEANDKVLRVSAGGAVFSFRPDYYTADINGQEVALDVPARNHDGRVYVPLRATAELLGAEVTWEPTRRTIVIKGGQGTPLSAGAGSPGVRFTAEELDLLTRVVNAEAYGEPMRGLIAVAAVILNRIGHPYFGSSLKDVIYQKGQFLVVWNGQLDRSLHPEVREAMRRALAGEDPSNGALFFYNPSRSTSSFWAGRPVTAEIGNHRFTR
ncbi:MAG: cell wall hydrolase [Firmicutes bacterium]|nr:cell wall hydrolase [Bacillota bacterium]